MKIKNNLEIAGIVLIDKEQGMYSNRVVEKIRRTLKNEKVGHLGTLDPLCTGLLPICIGKATRLSSLLMKSDKAYSATFLLGTTTDTYDIEGKVAEVKDIAYLSREMIQDVVKSFQGEILQVPPYFSAKKFKGRPLYKYARAGEFITLNPVLVRIYEIRIVDYLNNELRIIVHCSSGTYVRSLAHDIGRKLDCGACCKEMRRIQWDIFSEEHAIKLQDFCNADNKDNYIIPLKSLLQSSLPTIELDENLIAFFKKGHDLPISILKTKTNEIRLDNEIELLRATDNDGNLLGILKNNRNFLHPHIVL